MTRTYLDSGALIAAARAARAGSVLRVLLDPARQFVSSDFVKLEVMPKCVYHRQMEECAFYEHFFSRVSEWAIIDSRLVEAALKTAISHGLSGVDALHIASAFALRTEEFVTTEGRTKPIHRVKALRFLRV